jgi:hypothetical protein
MTSSLRGRSSVPVSTVCIPNAGIASTTSTAADAIADSHGRRSTLPRTHAHARLSPVELRRPCSSGTRPFSTRSPSQARIAGTTVIEPIIATATTMIAPTPSAVKVRPPAKNMPAMATITVKPETRIARPDVAAAVWTASILLAPRAFSSRSRRR